MLTDQPLQSVVARVSLSVAFNSLVIYGSTFPNILQKSKMRRQIFLMIRVVTALQTFALVENFSVFHTFFVQMQH